MLIDFDYILQHNLFEMKIVFPVDCTEILMSESFLQPINIRWINIMIFLFFTLIEIDFGPAVKHIIEPMQRFLI